MQVLLVSRDENKLNIFVKYLEVKEDNYIKTFLQLICLKMCYYVEVCGGRVKN
jgi:hypothetical protein